MHCLRLYQDRAWSHRPVRFWCLHWYGNGHGGVARSEKFRQASSSVALYRKCGIYIIAYPRRKTLNAKKPKNATDLRIILVKTIYD